MSIFHEYYQKRSFVDRFLEFGNTDPIDVIIPVIHTNELWKSNLLSIYREIPVNRLLIGDGGCIDNSIATACQFPRVVVLDHRQFVSLGYSIRKLVEAVETEWFVYLHSDVYLPPNWFEAMKANCNNYEWIECSPHLTILLDQPLDHHKTMRPFSGAQLGKTDAIREVASVIEDDYLYRNEDIILVELLQKSGYRYSRLYDVHHYHQEMAKKSFVHRKVKNIAFEWDIDLKEEVRASKMQVMGLIKYLLPRSDMPLDHYEYQKSLRRLSTLNEIDKREFYAWIEKTNPKWLSFHKKIMRKERRLEFCRAGKNLVIAVSLFVKSIYYLFFGLPEE